MRWDKCELDGVPKIVFLYGVDIFGWPKDIPFVCPGRQSVRSVETLLRGFRKKTIRFEQVHIGTLERYAADSGSTLQSRAMYARRADIFEKRALRPPETGSKRKPRKPVKTSRFVLEDE